MFLLFICVAALLIAGCDGHSSHNDDVSIEGIVSFADAIEGADVVVFDQQMQLIGAADEATNEHGAFHLELGKSLFAKNDYIVIRVKGGVNADDQTPFAGTLYYLLQESELPITSFLHVGPLSTIISHCTFDHPQWAVDDCISEVRALLEIPESIDENDLYFYAESLPGEVLTEHASENGGIDAYLQRIAGYVDNSADFDLCMVRDCSDDGTLLGSSATSEVLTFIGKQLAAGALTRSGNELAGWVFSGSADSVAQMAAIKSDLDRVLSQQVELKNKIDSLLLDNRISDFSEGLAYLEIWNEKITTALSLNDQASYEKYASQQQDELLKNEFPMEPFLIEIHNSLVGEGFSLALLDIYDEQLGNKGYYGQEYYQKMSEFMAYWGTIQNLALNLLCEYKHLKDESVDLNRILENQEERFTDQSTLFLNLVEKNLAIDKINFTGEASTNEDKIKSEIQNTAYQEGYDVTTSLAWVKENWSIYPELTLYGYQGETCVTHCSAGYCWDDCYHETYYRGEMAYAKASSSYSPSPDLQKADELVFALSLYQNDKPITLRFYVDPYKVYQPLYRCGIDSLAASEKVVTLVNTGTGKTYQAQPEMNLFEVPKSLYINDSSSWSTAAQMARYTFRDVPEGSYKLDDGVGVLFYHTLSGFTHTGYCGVNPYVVETNYLAYPDYYADYIIHYTKSGAAQNMLIMLYEDLE
nr:hypothetical protein [uncultured Desulfuromonas sp.]